MNSKVFSAPMILIMLAGCASQPLSTELPRNHPANPQATEARFSHLPNPFMGEVVPSSAQPSDTLTTQSREQGVQSQPATRHHAHNGKTDTKGKPEKRFSPEASDHQH